MNKLIEAQANLARNQAFRDLEELISENRGCLSHKDIQAVINKYKEKTQDVDRHHIDYRRWLVKNGKPLPGEVATVPKSIATNAIETDISPLSNPDDEEDETSPVQKEGENNPAKLRENIGGRKKGSTNEAKMLHLLKIRTALEEASTLCLQEKNAAYATNVRVKNGKYQEIVAEVYLKYDLPPDSFKYETVRSRVRRNDPTGAANQNQSPLVDIEPEIVEWCKRLSEMGEALTKSELMELADEVIRDTIHEDRMVEYQKKLGNERSENRDDGSILGEKWFTNFLGRWAIELKNGKCTIQDTKRRTWCNYENFENMYNAHYKAMVECGVAIELDHEVMFDRCGKEVTDPTLMYGRPTRYKITKPERCVFVDETGCNTNQKTQGQIGGRRHVTSRGQSEGATTGVTSDIHFTVLAFTAGTGEIILCCVILKSESESIPPSWRLGIDMTKNIETGRTEVEAFDVNCEKEVCIGGPVCYFNGKNLPTFVCSTPNASITSELLVEMMNEIDKQDVYERSEEIGIPFLLIDGHQSRTRLPFLKYVNNPITAWRACLGVPYGTHIWQPHDSPELNGSFKILLGKAKQNYLRAKPPNKQNFVTPDIIPILNRCFKDTLGNREFASKAISARGWNPLNYILLDDPRLIRTKTTTKNSSTVTGSSIETESFLQTFRHKSGTVFTSRLSSLIDEEKRSEGRKRKNEEIVKNMELNDENLKKLIKSIGRRPTSGSLYANGIMDLNKSVRDAVQEDENLKSARQQASMIKQQNSITKHQQAFGIAANKFFNSTCADILPLSDIRCLLREISVKGQNSPIKKSRADMEQQLHRRRDKMEVYRNRYGGRRFENDNNIPLRQDINDENMPPTRNSSSANNIVSVLEGANNIDNALNTLDRHFLEENIVDGDEQICQITEV